MNLGDRVLGPALRAEAVGTRLEVRLEDRLEHQLQGGLHDPVPDGRDAQPAQLAAALGIIRSRTGSGGTCRAFRSSRSSARNAVLARTLDVMGGLAVHPGRSRALGCPAPGPTRPARNGGITDEVEQVIEPAIGIVGRPSVQLGLDPQYPRLAPRRGSAATERRYSPATS